MTEEPQRYPLLPSTRIAVPIAIALGLAGIAFATGSTPRLVYAAGTLAVIALWLANLARRPVLVVDGEGYRVEVRRREVVRVRFDEVKRVRAVPGEQAMYLDCGDPKRNLLLPTRHGFGFRFARQATLYVTLAKRLSDRLEIADTLIPNPPETGKDPPDPDPAPATNGHSTNGHNRN